MLSTSPALRPKPLHLNLTCRRVTDDLSGKALCGSTFARAELFGTRFIGTDLTGSSFFEASAVDAIFDRAVLAHSRLWGATFTATMLRSANLRSTSAGSAVFHACNLSGADLRDSDLTGAHFDTCLMAGADVRGADLTGATVSQSLPEGLIVDDSTLLPEEWIDDLLPTPDAGMRSRASRILDAGWAGPLGDLMLMAEATDVDATIDRFLRFGEYPDEWSTSIADHLATDK